MSITVDIGIACAASQSQEWWGAVMTNLIQETRRGIEIGMIHRASSALPDWNKNNVISGRVPEFEAAAIEKGRNDKTDANRNVIARGFLYGTDTGRKSDWIWWLDDDTIPPDGALSQLLETGKDFVAGLYYNARHPFNPLAYIRNDPWGYKAIYNFPKGTLFRVDSVGMGCTLIHRSVYERIQAEHVCYVRPNGSFSVIHKSKVYNQNLPELAKQPPAMQEFISSGWLCQRVALPEMDDERAWPYYQMEYVRTEDHYFCELAGNVGIQPWVDTSIDCGHVKTHTYGYKEYREAYNESLGL